MDMYQWGIDNGLPEDKAKELAGMFTKLYSRREWDISYEATARMDALEAENGRLLEFCIMLRESIADGGRVVTFLDVDIEFLEAIGGE